MWVETNHIGESASRLEYMLLLVLFKWPPVAGKTEITDGAKGIATKSDVINNQTSLLQNIYLLIERDCMFGVAHRNLENKRPALVRCSSGKRGGYCRVQRYDISCN